MATYSSSSATGAGSMRAALMLMLLLGAVVAAHGRQVSFENRCGKPVTVNGVLIQRFDFKAKVNINVEIQVLIVLVDKTGALLSGSYYCPTDVTALVLVCELGCVKLERLPGLVPVSPVGGLVLGVLCCNCC